MSTKVNDPYTVISDLDGAPLEGGYVYIGDFGLDAEAFPKAAFWDEALTIAASQPIRTLAGRFVNLGSQIGNLYVDGSYSILVKDVNMVEVFSADVVGDAGAAEAFAVLSDYGDGTFSQANLNAMSADVGYIRIGAGMTVAANATVNDPIFFEPGAFVSVNDGVTVTIQAAVESPRQYIFRRTGTTGLVRFSNNSTEGEESRYCHVSWFGAFPLGDDTIDQAVFLQRCADAMGSTREGLIQFDTGTYYVRSKVTWSRANTVMGVGDRMTNIWAKGAIATTGDVWDTADQGILFRNFQFNSDSARTSGAYIRMIHQRCEAYDIYHDKAHEGIALNGNECKAYRTKALTQNTASGSASVSVQGNRCVIDGVDFTNFDTAFPESIVRVNAQAGSIETLTVQNITGDGECIGVLVEVGDGFTAKNLIIDGVAVELGIDQVKFELAGTGTIDNYSISNVAGSDGGTGINMSLAGTGNATNGAITGLTSEGLSDTLLRIFNTSTGIVTGLSFSGVSGRGAQNGIYIAGTGSPHMNISGSALSITGSGTDGVELKTNGCVLEGFVTNAATGVRLLSGTLNTIVTGQYTGVGTSLSDASSSETNRIEMTSTQRRTFVRPVVARGFEGGFFDIANDTAVTIPTINTGGIIVLNSTNVLETLPLSQYSAIVWFDLGTSLNIAKVSSVIGGQLDVVTTNVTGTSGTIGNVTVSAQTDVLKFENRSGGERRVRWSILA